MRFTLTSALILGAGAVMADPPIIPSPPPVFCFAKTGADAINGGDGIRIQFEILNWTGFDAHFLTIDANTDPMISTGLNAANEMFPASTPAPLFGPFVGKARTNDWSVVAADTNETSVKWAAGTPLVSGDPNMPPAPIDSGPNALDGFILDLPYLGAFERVVFQWSLLDDAMNPIDDVLGYWTGAFQIDRAMDAPNGAIRQSSFVSIGVPQFPPTIPQLDEGLTQQNARTDPSVGSNVVPLPPAAVLLMSAMAGIGALGFRRRGVRASLAA